MPHTRVKKVVAGPGAGKTTGLIDEILATLPSISANRFLVVITYTNAATEKIRSKLEKYIKIPPNLFIGTIHGFLDRFILIPHAAKLGIVPEEITFIDDLQVSDNRYKKVATKNARDKGVITYDQIEWLSEKIICGGKMKVGSNEVNLTKEIATNHAKAISRRLQCVFVDEYQDATLAQHNIFINLIKTDLIDYFYCVGDPEQYIYGFTYKSKSKKPAYVDIPIHKMAAFEGIESVQSAKNNRSQVKIVKFINHFASLKQEDSEPIQLSQPEVYFINGIDQTEMFNTFLSLCSRFQLTDKLKFVLSYAGNTVTCPGLTDINQFLDPSLSSERLLSETLRYISGIVGCSQREICRNKDWDEIDLRKMALKVLCEIKSGNAKTEDDIKTILSNDFEITCNSGRGYVNNCKVSLGKIISSMNDIVENPLNIRSTIHKAKGLEAYAVLVLAKTKSELVKWLEIDAQKRSNDESDTCRIGFVAFSRARELLCLGCLENVDDIRPSLESLGVSFNTQVVS